VNSQTGIIAALFVDATASAIYATKMQPVGGAAMSNLCFEHAVSSASTSSRTYRIRVGAVSGHIYVNGDSAARNYGGVSRARITIEERL